MWVEYNRAILRFAAEHPDDVVFVPFRALAEPALVVDILNERWGMGLRSKPDTAMFDPDATESRPGPQPLADHRLADTLRETWAQLEGLADGAAPSDTPDFDFYTPTEADLARMTNDRLALENPALRRNLELARQDLEASRQVVQRLQSRSLGATGRIGEGAARRRRSEVAGQPSRL